MITTNQTTLTKDIANKKIRVVREFDAPVDQVWRAWTEPELLDQWWAPKPWTAHTGSMDFREGGKWLYYMQGPDGEKSWCRADYETIEKGKRYTGTDAFCDEKGNVNTDFPQMYWDVQFTPSNGGTRVEVELTFASEADLNKILEMGFQEGFAAAHGNLDELLASQSH